MWVSVIYVAESGTVFETKLQFVEGMTALQAIEQSEVLARYAHEISEPLQAGIFSKRIRHVTSHLLQVGDRVELYRPLKIDPMQARRARALKNPVGKRQLRPHEYEDK